MAARLPHRAVVALAGQAGSAYSAGAALAESLRTLGIETIWLGSVDDAWAIAEAVSEKQADAVELCLSEHARGGVVLVRDLLRELIKRDRRDVSIVVHRVPAPARSSEVTRAGL
jgi:methylmalonyl-CoA mutase cobalamin-binding subunit